MTTPTAYAPTTRIDSIPPGPYTPPGRREAALLSALAGVDLGDYDRRIITWLSSRDDPTVATIVSLITRARAAGA